MSMQERRSANRFSLSIQGCAIINGSNVDLKTYDVSQGGALVEFRVPIALKIGAKLRVNFKIGFIGRAIICRINARDSHTLYGLKFDRFDHYSDLILSAYLVKCEHCDSSIRTIH